MTRPKPNFYPTPRILSAAQVAWRMNKAESWFSKNRSRLESEGFPPKDELLGGWDSAAMEAWLDQRSGLTRRLSDKFGSDSLMDALK